MIKKRAKRIVARFIASTKPFFRFKRYCDAYYSKVLFIQTRWFHVKRVLSDQLNWLKTLWREKAQQMVEVSGLSKKMKKKTQLAFALHE
jgi:hypothetical protein